MTTDAMVATVGGAREFKNGRHLSAWLGLVPSQRTTGGKTHLGSITRHGDRYLRTLLVQGARSSVKLAQRVPADRATREQRWIRSLVSRRSYGQVLVAVANKHARQMWALLAHGLEYDPEAGFRPDPGEAGALA